MELARYYLLAGASGLVWGGIALVLLGDWVPALGGGIAASPLMGLLIGLVHRPTYSLPLVLRVLLALATLYAAAALFGAVVGVTEALTISDPNVIKSAVVIGWVWVTLWGVTFTGYFLFLWPLAFANHWLLGWAWVRHRAGRVPN